MASTTVLSGLELMKWQRDFITEVVRESGFKPYMGSSPTDVIQVKNDLETDGFTIRIPLLARLKAAGVSGSTTLSGNEEALGQYFNDLTWEFYRHAVVTDKKSKKMSALDYMAEARPLLKQWASELIKFQLVDQFHTMTAGIPYATATAPQRNTFLTNNPDRTLFGVLKSNNTGVMAASLLNVDSAADKMSTAIGSLARRMARLAEPHIRPYRDAKGREHFVMFCNARSFRDLKADPVMVGANRDARAREADAMKDNPLFQDGDLIYDGVIYHEMPEFDVNRDGSGINPNGILAGAGAAAIDVGVNFLCGAQAVGFTNKQAPLPTTKSEDDYGFIDGVGIELAHGIKKLRWDNGAGTVKDHGMVTVYTAATPDT